MSRRFLVMGDNHGDTESLRRLLAETEAESFDFAVHVGDFTRAWRRGRRRGDERAGKEYGVEQLRDVEPSLAEIDERAEHGLLWVWGDQEYFGDLDYDLTVGTEVPDDGRVTVGGQRFTNAPAEVESDVILITHVEQWSLLDHFDGRAHFCGNTHLGRRKDRRLNSAFLQASEPDADAKEFGGYFVVEMDDAGAFDVEMRPVGDLERRVCDRHGERGVQFLPPDWECTYCRDRRILYRELAASAFYGLTGDSGNDGATVTDRELAEYAVGLWDDPPGGFRREFREYLADLDDDRYAPLARTDEGAIEVAEESYSY